MSDSLPPSKNSNAKKYEPRIGFSLRREVFFIVLGSIIGAVSMFVPRFISDFTVGTQYYIFWTVSARVLGSESYEIGIILHFLVATIIGIVSGLFLYKIKLLNISKISNGVIFGLFTGTIVFIVFAIPVQQLVLEPNIAELISELDPNTTLLEAQEHIIKNRVPGMIDSFLTHLIWGVTVGSIATVLTSRVGTNYRCHICDIQFSKLNTYYRHKNSVHDTVNQNLKKILIIGGGYAGVGVLRAVQKKFEKNVNVSIDLVSQTNFFLHTPMLAEMATGTIEPRHIATPIRRFCRRARFHQAKIVDIDLEGQQVKTVGVESDDRQKTVATTTLDYDYLVLATGGKTNFFGNKNIEKHALTIKTLHDAIRLRNHIISRLEEADQEPDYTEQQKLVTFVIVGGGFSGVETAGEINDFVRDSTEKFYRNINQDQIKVVLVASGEKILPEIGNLGEHAYKSLTKHGVTILTKTRLDDASQSTVSLNNGTKIDYGALVWAGGNTVEEVIANLDTNHHKSGRITVDQYLRLENHQNVYALGDCASIIETKTNQAYPPTAQHAIREAKTVANNIIADIKGSAKHKPFTYSTKGSMAKIGKNDGVALLLGAKFTGILAWFIWKQYYLATLPLAEKKIRVGIDWFVELFFSRDITRLDMK